VYFGWHYGGRIWERLFRFADHFDGAAGFAAAAFALSIRITAALYLGALGGGIVQFRRYRRLVAHQQSLAGAQTGAGVQTR
jgi:hypothetical protein